MPMPAFSLYRPLQGLPWYLLPIWPLIYFRIQRLRAWFKANGGPGSQMLWAVTNHGRADVVYLSDDMADIVKHPLVQIPLSRSFNTALAEQYERPAHPCPRRMRGPQVISLGIPARDPDLSGYLGPIPDT